PHKIQISLLFSENVFSERGQFEFESCEVSMTTPTSLSLFLLKMQIKNFSVFLSSCFFFSVFTHTRFFVLKKRKTKKFVLVLVLFLFPQTFFSFFSSFYPLLTRTRP